MDSDDESYFEESSSEDEQEVAGPLHINLEKNLEESPESPPPGPPSPAPAPPAPIPVENVAFVWELPDHGRNFINYFDRNDVLELRNWANQTRARMSEEGYVVGAPMVSQSFWAFLQYFHGEQWEIKFLKPAAETLFDQLLAYIAGYVRLTSLNRNLLRRSFEGWSASEKAENLRMLAESGGFLELE